jgi:hypothetical protein
MKAQFIYKNNANANCFLVLNCKKTNIFVDYYHNELHIMKNGNNLR